MDGVKKEIKKQEAKLGREQEHFKRDEIESILEGFRSREKETMQVADEMSARVAKEHESLEELDRILSVEGTVGAIMNVPVSSPWDYLQSRLLGRTIQPRHWVAIANLDKCLILDGKCEQPYRIEQATALPKSEVIPLLVLITV